MGIGRLWKSVTEQHRITQRENTLNIRRELREAKDECENKKESEETKATQSQLPLRLCYCLSKMLTEFGTEFLPENRLLAQMLMYSTATDIYVSFDVLSYKRSTQIRLKD